MDCRGVVDLYETSVPCAFRKLPPGSHYSTARVGFVRHVHLHRSYPPPPPAPLFFTRMIFLLLSRRSYHARFIFRMYSQIFIDHQNLWSFFFSRTFYDWHFAGHHFHCLFIFGSKIHILECNSEAAVKKKKKNHSSIIIIFNWKLQAVGSINTFC